ncbi:hypothetical protein B0H14DRAFT_2609287 [Mycena olivaceomarginata]|nr:hypothetical protein B0H14DRAFT_2609287 [Mycena olivaceomarginata]
MAGFDHPAGASAGTSWLTMRRARAKFIDASRHFPGVRDLNSSSASPTIFSALSVIIITSFLPSICKGIGIFCTRHPKNAFGSSTSDVANEEIRWDTLARYPHRHEEGQRPRRFHHVFGSDEQRFLLLRVGEERLEAGADVQVAYTSRGPGGRLVCSGEPQAGVVGAFHKTVVGCFSRAETYHPARRAQLAFCGKNGSQSQRGGGEEDHRRRFEVSGWSPACLLGRKKTGSRRVKTW